MQFEKQNTAMGSDDDDCDDDAPTELLKPRVKMMMTLEGQHGTSSLLAGSNSSLSSSNTRKSRFNNRPLDGSPMLAAIDCFTTTRSRSISTKVDLDLDATPTAAERAVSDNSFFVNSNKSDNNSNQNGTAKNRRESTKELFDRRLNRIHSSFYQENPSYKVPLFVSSELSLGDQLGEGEFGSVYEIEYIKRQPPPPLDFQVILGDENGSQDHSKGSTSSAPVGSIPTTLPLATVGTGNFDNFLRRRLEAFEFQESDLLPTPITQQEIQPTRSKPNTGRERPFNNNDNDNNDNDNDNDNGNDNDNNDNEQNGYTTTKQQFATKNHPTKANSDGESFELQAAAQQLKDRKAQMISRQNNSDVNNSFDGYAVKVVRDDIHNERKKRVATADMASEAKLLSALSHRNIISIRGIMGYIEHPGNYGIIMDKLRSTLQDQIHEWARVTSEDKVPRAAPGKHPVLEHIPQWMLVRQHEKDKQRKLFRQTEFFVERMEAVSDVSQAMKYLHEKRIIFRDLKPENVGLTKDNYVLFDFGLSRELTESDRVVGGNDAKCEDQYHATGLTGSRLFMAPEVATNKPYGFSADVYSFAILFWEVVSLTQVFPTMTMNKHYKLVIVKGKRPPSLEDILPSELNEMLEASWDKVPSNRPTFESICEILTHELEKHDNNNNNNNNNNTSASSFLPFLNKNNASASSFLHFLSHSHQATEPQP